MNMIGQLLDGRYRIIQVLSSGAFGQTYLAADTRRPGHPQCVVKQLRPPSNRSTVLKTAHRLFKQEAEILEKLGKHDQIPFLLAYFEEGNQFYLVEEFIPGHSLAKELLPGKAWPEERVLELLEEVLEILVFVHQNGVIHRDVNPSNLIRRKTDNKLVLIDFGSVKEVSTQMTLPPDQMPRTIATGTPSYMPVEQFQGNPQFSSDLYAVGMIAIQALTGLPAGDLPKLQDPNPAHGGDVVWQHLAPVNSALAEVINKMVHHHFSRRYHAAEEVLDALHKLKHSSHKETGVKIPGASWQWPPQWLGENAGAKLRFAILGILLIFLSLGVLRVCSRPDPERAKLYYNQGLEQARAGEIDKAIESFTRVIEFAPDHSDAFYRRGNALFDKGDLSVSNRDQISAIQAYEAAVADYTTVIDLSGNNQSKAYFNRGLAYYELGQIGNAIEDFSQVITLHPQDAEAYYKRGLAYYDIREYGKAIEDYNRVLQLQPQDNYAYHSRGLAYAASGNLNAAIGDYTRMIQLDPNEITGYYSRGRARFHIGDYRGALDDYSQVIKIDPKNMEAYANRCSTQINLRDYQAAINDCTAAIELNPEDTVAYNNRCIAHLNLRDYQSAINDCSQSIEIDSQNTKAYSNRGLARSAAGNHQGAIDDYTQAIQINPNDAEAYANRAQVYADLKNYDIAIADYAQAIRLKPTYAGAYNGRGIVRLALGDKRGAIEDLEKAGKYYLEQGWSDAYKNVQAQIDRLR